MRQGHPSGSGRSFHPERRRDLHLSRRIIPVAKQALAGSGVKVASVSTGFPSGQTYTDVKLLETRQAVEAGADEIDMVIDRGAFLEGDYRHVFDEIVAIKEACGNAHLKVILETGELETYDNVRRASILAMAAGADFIKTSTGKVTPAATLPVTLVMLEAIRDFHRRTGRIVGMKPAGGIRTAKEAIQYLVVLYETLGPRWMTPDLFRFGASSLLNDVLMQIHKERTGRLPGTGLLHGRLAAIDGVEASRRALGSSSAVTQIDPNASNISVAAKPSTLSGTERTVRPVSGSTLINSSPAGNHSSPLISTGIQASSSTKSSVTLAVAGSMR